ncbi:MAG: HEPN domain-containing protein [Clostridiales bacterium]|nr:HEPN domain-containing protein [Clostridiales bacterium]
MDTKSYLSFAENDYEFFKEIIKGELVYNALPSIAQNACEKYLKDLIDRFFVPENNHELNEKTSIMRTHSLSKLLKFLEKQMDLEISDEFKDNIEKGDGYYFSTRYPGDNSIEVDMRDIRKADTALEYTRMLHQKIEQLYVEDEHDDDHEQERCP